MSIRGKPLSLIRETLETLRAEVGSGRSRTFILSAGGVGFPVRKLLTSWGAQRILLKSLRGGKPALLRLPTAIASFRIKNNARLFYADGAGESRMRAAKIGLASQNRSGSLAREIKAHRLMARNRGKAAPIPQLLRYDTSKLSWLVEEFVERCPQLDRGQKAELFLSRYAQHLYTPFVRSRPVSSYLQTNRISVNALSKVFARAGSKLPKDVVSATWPVALLHGDLSEGNMIATRERELYLVDWEKFRRGPVAWDMRKLFDLCPHPVRALLDSLSERRDLDPDMQMRIIFAAELILAARRRTNKVAYLTGDRGVTTARAEELIDHQVAKRIDLIRRGPSG